MEYDGDRMDTSTPYNSETCSRALCNTNLDVSTVRYASELFNSSYSTSQSLLSEGMENSTLLTSYIH